MRFHKFISTLLPPIVMPFIGVMLYFLLVSTGFYSSQKLSLLGLIFIATYIVPLLLLLVLKMFGQIKTYQIKSIKEQKFPLAFMIVLFYVLGNTMFRISQIRDIGLLFYTYSFGLVAVYLFFFLQLKISLHVFSLSTLIGFLMILQLKYSVNILPVVIVICLISGWVASARLHLKVHTPKEVYIGFFLGIITSLVVYHTYSI